MQLSRGNRRGRNFCVRISDADLEAFRRAGFGRTGPRSLGPWLIWSSTRSGYAAAAKALPGPGPGNAGTSALPGPVASIDAALPPPAEDVLPRPGNAAARVILDLCSGSGAWSQPYADAGYQVERIDILKGRGVEDFTPASAVHGVLAAPPCTEFSIAKTLGQRQLGDALVVVTHCLRVIALARPVWWALENPGSGLLRRWLGPPRDVWQPCDFGDPWTKLTAVWGDFVIPQRRHCMAVRGMPGSTSAERAVTPAGFAAAFFAANP